MHLKCFLRDCDRNYFLYNINRLDFIGKKEIFLRGTRFVNVIHSVVVVRVFNEVIFWQGVHRPPNNLGRDT
jgi:hypothetical protein